MDNDNRRKMRDKKKNRLIKQLNRNRKIRNKCRKK